MDWLDLLAVQGTLKSLLQHHSSKASILLPSAFFIVQLSHPYMTTGKTITLTKWTFVDKVMSLVNPVPWSWLSKVSFGLYVGAFFLLKIYLGAIAPQMSPSISNVPKVYSVMWDSWCYNKQGFSVSRLIRWPKTIEEDAQSLITKEM